MSSQTMFHTLRPSISFGVGIRPSATISSNLVGAHADIAVELLTVQASPGLRQVADGGRPNHRPEHAVVDMPDHLWHRPPLPVEKRKD